MSERVIVALRVVLGIAVLGSVVVQVAAVLIFSTSPRISTAQTVGEAAAAVIVILGIGILQVVAHSIWRLLGMVRRHTVFSSAAFRYIDRIIVAIAAGGVLLFALAVTAAPSELPPGLVALLCGGALVTIGVALVVYVQRALLEQAVRRDAEARELEAELGEVI